MGAMSHYTGSLLLMATIIQIVLSAPVLEESQALETQDLSIEGKGCYYNFEHYEEGDRILTNEPCLNCTCHNRMLMCYLRVCPFTKAIGQDCMIEKKPDQCCPVITCPQVPVALLTSTTELPQTTTALGRPDNYGCTLDDNKFYADGAQVPSDPRKPCELCYCIRNHTACVMQECTLNVEGCRPVYQEGVCCPVRYDCDYEDVLTTPKPTLGLITTPGGPSDCRVNETTYHDGEMIEKMTTNPCEHCYCMRGDVVCAVQECGTPLQDSDCTAKPTEPGQCCPSTYECANGTIPAHSLSKEKDSATAAQSNEEVIHHDTPPQVTQDETNDSSEEEDEAKKPAVSTDDDKSDESSEEQDSEEKKPEKPAVDVEGNREPTEQPYPDTTQRNENTEEKIPEEPDTSDAAEIDQQVNTDVPEVHHESTEHVEPVQEHEIPSEPQISITEKPADELPVDITTSANEPAHEEHVHEEEHHQAPIDITTVSEGFIEHVEITTESPIIEDSSPSESVVEDVTPKAPEPVVPELPPPSAVDPSESETPKPSGSLLTNELPETTTVNAHHDLHEDDLDPAELARVPGEGSCLFQGRTYAPNTEVPTTHVCQSSCRCVNSIVRCQQIECPQPPLNQYTNCKEIKTAGSCCPTYECDQKPSDAPVIENQLNIDKIDDQVNGDGSSGEEPSSEEGSPTTSTPIEEQTVPPVVIGIPPDNLVLGTDEEDQGQGQISSEKEEHASGEESNKPSESHHESLDPQVVHSDSAVHGGSQDTFEPKPGSEQSQNNLSGSQDSPIAFDVPEELTTRTPMVEEEKEPVHEDTSEAGLSTEVTDVDITTSPSSVEGQQAAGNNQIPVEHNSLQDPNHESSEEHQESEYKVPESNEVPETAPVEHQSGELPSDDIVTTASPDSLPGQHQSAQDDSDDNTGKLEESSGNDSVFTDQTPDNSEVHITNAPEHVDGETTPNPEIEQSGTHIEDSIPSGSSHSDETDNEANLLGSHTTSEHESDLNEAGGVHEDNAQTVSDLVTTVINEMLQNTDQPAVPIGHLPSPHDSHTDYLPGPEGIPEITTVKDEYTNENEESGSTSSTDKTGENDIDPSSTGSKGEPTYDDDEGNHHDDTSPPTFVDIHDKIDVLSPEDNGENTYSITNVPNSEEVTTESNAHGDDEVNQAVQEASTHTPIYEEQSSSSGGSEHEQKLPQTTVMPSSENDEPGPSSNPSGDLNEGIVNEDKLSEPVQLSEIPSPEIHTDLSPAPIATHEDVPSEISTESSVSITEEDSQSNLDLHSTPVPPASVIPVQQSSEGSDENAPVGVDVPQEVESHNEVIQNRPHQDVSEQQPITEQATIDEHDVVTHIDSPNEHSVPEVGNQVLEPSGPSAPENDPSSHNPAVSPDQEQTSAGESVSVQPPMEIPHHEQASAGETSDDGPAPQTNLEEEQPHSGSASEQPEDPQLAVISPVGETSSDVGEVLPPHETGNVPTEQENKPDEDHKEQDVPTDAPISITQAPVDVPITHSDSSEANIAESLAPIEASSETPQPESYQTEPPKTADSEPTINEVNEANQQIVDAVSSVVESDHVKPAEPNVEEPAVVIPSEPPLEESAVPVSPDTESQVAESQAPGSTDNESPATVPSASLDTEIHAEEPAVTEVLPQVEEQTEASQGQEETSTETSDKGSQVLPDLTSQSGNMEHPTSTEPSPLAPDSSHGVAPDASLFPNWAQKPYEPQTTSEATHLPDDSHYPSGYEQDYEDDDAVSYGPGTCRYGGKVYLSAQQIPRDDPCDFCFCFRSDIICLQQSCPPPIKDCYQETIKGFCCPRYECHVSMATVMNITTTTTTTTTTLPPHFFTHAYSGAATKGGCQVKGIAYRVGDRIQTASGPCLDCRCGGNGQMQCNPSICSPQEALLRQVMDAASVSRRR